MSNAPTDFAQRVIDTSYRDELEESFLPYAMTVITGRALPDVRDGLKPVQRRILYGMLRQGSCSPTDAHTKSAQIVGEVMGKYHPHGDSSIYEAMVRMGQDFTYSCPLIDPQGNFGSPDDPPAAYRYTEARMAPAAVEMLEALDEGTVDMVPNYSAVYEEPVVLPAKFPNLLVNGASGVAVGFTCAFIPHNKTEVLEAALLVLDGETNLSKIMEVLPGPDFPTGGIILDRSSFAEIYETGRGSVTVRGRASVEKVTARKHGIVVTELPYQVGPEALITKIKALMADGKLPGIAAVANYSDRRVGLRVVIECKASADPEAELRRLYAKTPLQTSISVNHTGLLDGVPSTHTLVQLLEHWIAHRLEVVRLRSITRKTKAETRLHLVEGYLLAMADIDEVVKVIRTSDSRSAARTALVKKFKLSEIQANAILDMALGRLTSLEVQKLVDEQQELLATIKRLEGLIKSEARRRTVVRKETGELLSSPVERRSEISDTQPLAAAASAAPAALPTESSTFVLSPLNELACDREAFVLAQACVTTPMAAVVDETGHVQHVRAFEGVLPAAEAARTAAEPVALLPLDPDNHIVLVTRDGKVKRVEPEVWRTAGDAALVCKLGPGDAVVAALAVAPEDDIVLVSNDGRVLRTGSSGIPTKGLSAGGVAGMKHPDGCFTVAAVTAAELISVRAANGALATIAADEVATKNRGGKGMKLANLREDEALTNQVWSHATGELCVLVGRGKTPKPFPAERRARGRALTKNTETFRQVGIRPTSD